MAKFWNKYKHAIPIFAYMALYLAWFAILEKKVTTYRIIHTAADDLIPFCEFFVIPYFTWSNRGENEMKVWLAVRG